MKIDIKTLDELTEDQREEYGCYDDQPQYMVIEWDDGEVEVRTDNMETEDATFRRALYWISGCIEKAYMEGYAKGVEAGERH